jgi:hypothetical protein
MRIAAFLVFVWLTFEAIVRRRGATIAKGFAVQKEE